MKTDTLDCIEINSSNPPLGSVIWLHGLGADGHDFEPIVSALGLPENLPLRFVFPHAKMRPVTLNGGFPCRAWYDIKGLEADADEDEAGIYAAEQQLRRLIADEIAQGISADKILLAGFSQGGALALHTGLRYEQTLAGILALSTYLPLHERLEKELSRMNRSVPIFMAHGTKDTVISYEIAKQVRLLLASKNNRIDFRTYDMAHSVCEKEIADISAWIQSIFLSVSVIKYLK